MCVLFEFFFFREGHTSDGPGSRQPPASSPAVFFLKTCTSSSIIIINHLHDLLQRHQQEEHQLRTGKGKKNFFFCYTLIKTAIFFFLDIALFLNAYVAYSYRTYCLTAELNVCVFFFSALIARAHFLEGNTIQPYSQSIKIRYNFFFF